MTPVVKSENVWLQLSLGESGFQICKAKKILQKEQTNAPQRRKQNQSVDSTDALEYFSSSNLARQRQVAVVKITSAKQLQEIRSTAPESQELSYS